MARTRGHHPRPRDRAAAARAFYRQHLARRGYRGAAVGLEEWFLISRRVPRLSRRQFGSCAAYAAAKEYLAGAIADTGLGSTRLRSIPIVVWTCEGARQWRGEGGRDATLCRDVEGNCHPRSGPWPGAA